MGWRHFPQSRNGQRRKPRARTGSSLPPPLYSWNRAGRSGPGTPCVRLSAAIGLSICSGCSPSSALRTTGRCSTPTLEFEEDASELLRVNEELARLLLQDPEAARCDMGVRLFSELTELRDLHEKRELEKAKSALEAQVRQKELLLKEVNHRVKNSLQIVSSILDLQAPVVEGTDAADAMRNAAAQVLAIAAVHERLYTGDDPTVVRLDTFLSDLCQDIGRAYGCADGIETDVERIEVPTDMAVPLALIVNELVTNVVKHVGPPCRLTLRGEIRGTLKLAISDKGRGPIQQQSRPGLGTQLVEGLSKELGARIETRQDLSGYTIELLIPLPHDEMMRVLIVENSTIIAMHLAKLVTDLGHEVCARAASASDAIAQAAALKPDVAIMDLRLAKGSSGVDAARALYERHALRCIIVSGNLDEPTRAALVPYDPIDFLGKPVLPLVLQRALKKAEGLTGL